MRFNLRTKLIGSFAIVLLLTLVVGLIGIYTSKTTITRVEKLVEQDVKELNILGDIARKISFIRSNSLLHLITESRDDKNRYESEIADWQSKIRTDLDNLEKIYRDQATLDKLAEFRSAWETYVSIWDGQVKPLSRANRNEEAFALARKKGAAGIAAQEVVYKLNKLNDAIVSKATRRIELAEQDFRKSQIILLSVILLAIILGLAFALKQSSLIAGPVNIVSKAAQLVAAGDLDQSVKVRTGDEIESMADSFNTMISNMKKMVEELRHEITEREKAEKALQEAKDGLEVMVEKRTSELRMINEQLWREVTEREKAEEQTEQLQERLQLQIDRMPIGLIVWDLDFHVQSWNPAAEKIFGFTAEEALGKHPYDLIVPRDVQPHVDTVWRRLLEGDTTAHSVNENITKNGRTIICEWSNTPLKEADGIGALSMVQDITERKKSRKTDPASDRAHNSSPQYRHGHNIQS